MPNIGRFHSQDPWLGNDRKPGTLNRYVYVLNSPPNGIDPSGLLCVMGFGNCDEESDLIADIYRAIPIPDDFCLPGDLGCWGGDEYADWLETVNYPVLHREWENSWVNTRIVKPLHDMEIDRLWTTRPRDMIPQVQVGKTLADTSRALLHQETPFMTTDVMIDLSVEFHHGHNDNI